jgi:hypothetical protein
MAALCWRITSLLAGDRCAERRSDLAPGRLYDQAVFTQDSQDFQHASISTDGRYLALASAYFGDPFLDVIDIASNTALWFYPFADEMRWLEMPSDDG